MSEPGRNPFTAGPLRAGPPEPEFARAARGDASAFERIVEEHQAMVFSLAYHFTRDAATAEELAQDVFMLLHRDLGSIQSEAHLKSWLRKVTAHRAIDYTRRVKMDRVSLDETPEPVAASAASDPLLAEHLRRLVSTLPARARMMVILRYQEELELHEIAETLGEPINTVKSTLKRALALMRDKLERQLGDVKV